MQVSAPSMAEADEALIVKRVTDPDYIDELIQLCKDHQITALISLNDLELPILSEHKSMIEEKTGTHVIVPSQENKMFIYCLAKKLNKPPVCQKSISPVKLPFSIKSHIPKRALPVYVVSKIIPVCLMVFFTKLSNLLLLCS